MFGDNEGFDFGSLNLEKVQASQVSSVLPPGKYVCATSNAKVEPTKDGKGKYLSVLCKDVKGKGVITARLNLHLPHSAQATQIGLEQLKALLVCGGHVDPDNIGAHGTASINGLTVGVVVKKDSYNGEDRSQVSGFCKPSVVPGYADVAPAETGTVGDKDIPF